MLKTVKKEKNEVIVRKIEAGEACIKCKEVWCHVELKHIKDAVISYCPTLKKNIVRLFEK